MWSASKVLTHIANNNRIPEKQMRAANAFLNMSRCNERKLKSITFDMLYSTWGGLLSAAAGVEARDAHGNLVTPKPLKVHNALVKYARKYKLPELGEDPLRVGQVRWSGKPLDDERVFIQRREKNMTHYRCIFLSRTKIMAQDDADYLTKAEIERDYPKISDMTRDDFDALYGSADET